MGETQTPLPEVDHRVVTPTFRYTRSLRDSFEGEGSGATAEVQRAGDSNPRYVYEVWLYKPSGHFRRWRGRVVMINPSGERHYWPWRTARSRDRALKTLWDETMLDIQWRTGSGAVHVLELSD